VYKKLDSPKFKGLNQSLMFVPVQDEHYGGLPWAGMTPAGWGVLFSVGMLIPAFVIGAMLPCCAVLCGCSGAGEDEAKSDTVVKEGSREGAMFENSHIMPRIEFITNLPREKNCLSHLHIPP
jgi:hypothetical protein